MHNGENRQAPCTVALKGRLCSLTCKCNQVVVVTLTETIFATLADPKCKTRQVQISIPLQVPIDHRFLPHVQFFAIPPRFLIMRLLAFSFLAALGPLSAFAVCHWTIFLGSHRSSPGPLAISDSQAELVLARHLGLEKSFPPRKDQITVDSWYNFTQQSRSLADRGPGSPLNAMLVSIESQDPEGK